MPALSFSDFDALPDVLATDRFEILMTPSAASDINQVLGVRCTQLALPQEQTEQMLVAIQGMEFNFRGRRVYDKILPGTFVETTDGAVSQGISGWTQQVAGSESHNGLDKKGYSTQGTINVFDQSGNTALTWFVDNLWPMDKVTVQLDGSSAQPFLQPINFSFDRFQPPVGVDMN